MAFNKIDIEALKTAQERGFITKIVSASKYGWNEPVFEIEFGQQVSNEFASKEITQLLEALIRSTYTDRTTLWLNITTDMIHESIIDAISGCWYFRPKLYVTYKNFASHAPAPPLPDRLQNAIEKIASKGRMWHPILCEETDGLPSRTRRS